MPAWRRDWYGWCGTIKCPPSPTHCEQAHWSGDASFSFLHNVGVRSQDGGTSRLGTVQLARTNDIGVVVRYPAQVSKIRLIDDQPGNGIRRPNPAIPPPLTGFAHARILNVTSHVCSRSPRCSS